MTNQPTRAVDIRMSDGTIIGKAVWAWGECTIITPVESHREPRLDSNDDLVVRLMIAAIKAHNEHLEFLWDDYLEAS